MAEERIISHMNKDHYLSLYDYLAYYGDIKLDPFDGRSAVEMSAIDLRTITLKYTSNKNNNDWKTKQISFNPTLTALADARVSLTDMAKTAAQSLNVSPYQVNRYVSPLSGTVISSLFTASIISYAVLVAIRPSAALWAPYTGKFFYSRPFVPIATAMVVHALESLLFLRPLLDKYRVPQPTRMKWVLSHFLEGYPTIQRLKAEINRLEH